MRFFLLSPVLVFCGLAGTCLSAVPANDSFSSRAVTTIGSTSGSNIEATVEAGEPRLQLDALPTATVWWTFTPGISGWYELSTAGSGIDTVLAVYEGTDLSSLVRIVAADDDALNDSVTTSRVRFQALGGVAYAIQADGYDDAARGSISLSIQPVAEPLERVTSLSLSPVAPFDVSTGEQIVGLTFGLKQNAALDYGLVYVSRPDGTVLRELNFTAANRIAGTPSEGTYQLNVTLPRYAAGGNYPLWIKAWSVNPASGAPGVNGGGWVWTSLPAPVAPHFTISNTGAADVAAPGLTSAVFSQPSVNVTATSVIVPLTLQITDNLSGFSSASVLLEQSISPDETEVLTAATAGAANRTGGTAMNGQYQVQFLIPQNAGAGLWTLRCVLTDSLGNTASVTSTATLTVNKTPYTAWANAQGLTASAALPDADPDHDGQTNLEEFAFHTEPKRADLKRINPGVPERVYRLLGAAPYQYFAGGELHLRFIRRRGANAGAATTVPQFGSNLTDWAPATELTVTPFSAEWEMVDARDTDFGSESGLRRFGRVLVTLP